MADLTQIRRDMQVVSSDGEVVGHVSSLEGGVSVSPVGASGSGGHQVPADWIARVDEHVHLRHSAGVIRGRWSGNAEPRPHRTEGGAKLPWLIGLVLLAIAVLLLIWGFVYSADGSRDTTEPLPSTGASPSGS